MANSVKIAIRISNGPNAQTDFSIRLKKLLEKEPASFHTTSRITFLNGQPGGFNTMVKSLIHCGIVDRKLNWTFGDGHVVITGNCLDGSEKSVQLLWLIYSLESKALKRGGYLHFLPGVSEILNIEGSWRARHPAYASRKDYSTHSYAVLFDGNNELYRWLRTKNVVEQVGHFTILHANLAKGFEEFLPKLLGKKFPEKVKAILQLPFSEIHEEHMEDLFRIFGTSNLLITDSSIGFIKIFGADGERLYTDGYPLLYENGRYSRLSLETS